MNTDLTPEPTPRVDAAQIRTHPTQWDADYRYVSADFARGLERELAALKKGLEEEREKSRNLTHALMRIFREYRPDAASARDLYEIARSALSTPGATLN